MVDDSLTPSIPRFGAGLAEAEVRRFQTILREECCVELPLTDAWSRAIELLSLTEMLLQSRGLLGGSESLESTGFALPRS
jgi:hypothetical protein